MKVFGRTLAALLAMFAAMSACGNDGDRVASARKQSLPRLKARFVAAGVAYPADEIFLRVHKREAQTELWARGGAREKFKLVHTFEVKRASGVPGPKRREGDMQVPEGFYVIDRFNPKSNFHLSLGLNYPNASDRIRSDSAKPGGDIFIHGKSVTIGCVPLGDEGIEELYLAALDSRARPIHVHIFPARMDGESWTAWRDEQTRARPELAAFWKELRAGWELFEKSHTVPKVDVAADGAYTIK